jgi:hypothetical protein
MKPWRWKKQALWNMSTYHNTHYNISEGCKLIISHYNNSDDNTIHNQENKRKTHNIGATGDKHYNKTSKKILTDNYQQVITT